MATVPRIVCKMVEFRIWHERYRQLLFFNFYRISNTFSKGTSDSLGEVFPIQGPELVAIFLFLDHLGRRVSHECFRFLFDGCIIKYTRIPDDYRLLLGRDDIPRLERDLYSFLFFDNEFYLSSSIAGSSSNIALVQPCLVSAFKLRPRDGYRRFHTYCHHFIQLRPAALQLSRARFSQPIHQCHSHRVQRAQHVLLARRVRQLLGGSRKIRRHQPRPSLQLLVLLRLITLRFCVELLRKKWQ
jgi:hypothetical protein